MNETQNVAEMSGSSRQFFFISTPRSCPFCMSVE